MLMPELILGATAGPAHPLRRYVTRGGDEHVMLWAPPRTGKGVGVVLPNCFAWQGSAVVLDIRREAWEATVGHRAARLGQAVFLFDPMAEDGRTARYNPFSYVDRANPVTRMDAIMRIAVALFPDSADRSSSSDFWLQSARAAFIGVAGMIAETPGVALTLGAVLDFFTRADAKAAIVAIIARARRREPPYDELFTLDTVRSLASYIGASDAQAGSTYEGIRLSVVARLQLWTNPRVRAATAQSDFDLRELRRTPTSLYVAVSPNNIEMLRPLLGLLFQQLIDLSSTTTPRQDPSLRHQVLLLLDEFRTIGYLQHLANSFAFIAGYGLRALIVLQDTSQLVDVYGEKGARTIMSGCADHIMFGVGDEAAAEDVSRRLGTDTVLNVTRHRPRLLPFLHLGKQTEALHQHRRSVLLPQEVRMLADSRMIVLRRGVNPMLLHKLRWFADARMRDLPLTPPLPPQLTVPILLDDLAPVMPAGTGQGTRPLRRDQDERAESSRRRMMRGR